MKQLWTEMYRPQTVADYVFRDDEQRGQVQGWITKDAVIQADAARREKLKN